MKKSNEDNEMSQIKKAIIELVESQKKTDEQIRETEDLVKKTNKSVAQLTDGWGMFVEGLVAPSIPKIFKKLGIEITEYGSRRKARVGSRSIEMDVIASGKKNRKIEVVIATSVKSRLHVNEVKDHLKKLDEFFSFYPKYKGCELIGVVAGVRLDEGVVSYAQKQGFYIIGSSGEAVELLNKKGFKPKIWKEDGKRRGRDKKKKNK